MTLQEQMFLEDENLMQRCNHCMEVFDADFNECPECGKDDALMYIRVDELKKE